MLTWVAQHLKGHAWWLHFFAYLGFVMLARFTIFVFTCVYTFILRPNKDLVTTYGSWAVITGATDGIGRSYAFDLAQKGLNLVLLGRNPNKLQQVSDEIITKVPKVKIRTVVADLSENVKEGARRLYDEIEGLDVGLLINNAGVSEPRLLYFHEGYIESLMKMINVNLCAVTEITRAVLPMFLKRGRGVIVNMGSGSSVVIPSHPLFTIYAATKSYVRMLSKSLHQEYKDNGICVQCQAPLHVTTNLTAGSIEMKWYSYLLEPKPDTYVKQASRWIGYESFCIPYWPHFIQWCFASYLPNYIHYKMRLRANLKRRAMEKELKIHKEG